MYFKKLHLENAGPLPRIDLDFPFNDEGIPKPVIFVGGNGSGKTVALSYLTDALTEISKNLFSDTVDTTKKQSPYFRVISNSNITAGAHFSLAVVDLTYEDNEITYIEKAGTLQKASLSEEIQKKAARIQWSEENPIKFVNILPNQNEIVQAELRNSCNSFFPTSRFENPSWLNLDGLPPSFKSSKRIRDELNKPLLVETSLELNHQWLLDVMLDSSILFNELNSQSEALQVIQQATKNNEQATFTADQQKALQKWLLANTNTASLNNANRVLQLILQDEEAQFQFANRNSSDYRIAILKGGVLLPGLGSLSTGESTLLNIFITLLRYADKYNIANSQNLDAVRGIVMIDEADSHLHVDLQFYVFPELVKLFPNVQFILTSHSPLLSLGMESVLGGEDVLIIDFPTGSEIDAEMFSEFGSAFDVYANTRRFGETIIETVDVQEESVLIVSEGKSDWKHLLAALNYFKSQGRFTSISDDWFLRYGSAEDVSSTLCGTNHLIEHEMGHGPLKNYLEQLSHIRRIDPSQERKQRIGIFDSDVKNLKLINDDDTCVGSFMLCPDEEISIEFLYKDNEIKSEVEGRRLFIGDEFHQTSKRSKFSPDLSLAGNGGILNKAGKREIIDTSVFNGNGDSLALSKDRFASAIFNNEIEISEESWERFAHIFENIEQIVSGSQLDIHTSESV